MTSGSVMCYRVSLANSTSNLLPYGYEHETEVAALLLAFAARAGVEKRAERFVVGVAGDEFLVIDAD